ncbi:LapA family protein [Dactylosporangium sp. McL0621]|uniref:LapA family protein n=1 Tax=Dactylosporangium sp. McL0621 TaxID=3415678 RepID=UPI003CF37E90
MTAPQHPQDIPQPTNGYDSRADLTASTPRRTRTPHSRVGEVWVAAVLFALILLLLLIFLLQNGQPAKVSFFGAHGQLPMGVALLLAAVFGILLVALPGTARIVQLRLLSRRHTVPGPSPAPQSPAGEPSGQPTHESSEEPVNRFR